jgi:hypothetical protein
MVNDQPDTFRDDFDLGEAKAKPPAKADPFGDRAGWGLFPEMPFADYLADPAPEPSLSNSGMGILLAKTPLDFAFQHPRLNPDPERLADTAAQVMGNVVHRLALGKGADYAVLPEEFVDFRKDAAKEFKRQAIECGKVPILAEKFKEAELLAKIARERIERALDGAAYQTEVVFLYQEMTEAGPIWCRGMLDVWSEEAATVLDLKITGQIYDASVARQMVNMGWDRQEAFYKHAVGAILPELGGRVRFADLLIKPEAPFTSRLVSPEKGWSATSIRQCRIAMERFGACIHSGKWPGFPNRVDQIAMPRWEESRREAMELNGESVG